MLFFVIVNLSIIFNTNLYLLYYSNSQNVRAIMCKTGIDTIYGDSKRILTKYQYEINGLGYKSFWLIVNLS